MNFFCIYIEFLLIKLINNGFYLCVFQILKLFFCRAIKQLRIKFCNVNKRIMYIEFLLIKHKFFFCTFQIYSIFCIFFSFSLDNNILEYSLKWLKKFRISILIEFLFHSLISLAFLIYD